MEQSLNLHRKNLSVFKDLGSSRHVLNCKYVEQTFEVLENWGNPFQPRESLICISSGVVATKEITKDVLFALEKGQTASQKFFDDRIKSQKVSFYNLIKKIGLKSFTDLKIKKTIKVKEKSITLAAERSIFGRMLAVAKRQEGLSLETLLTFSLSPIPWCFGLPDGGLVKTVKSKLLSE